jgi:hypothetical protein
VEGAAVTPFAAQIFTAIGQGVSEFVAKGGAPTVVVLGDEAFAAFVEVMHAERKEDAEAVRAMSQTGLVVLRSRHVGPRAVVVATDAMLEGLPARHARLN